MWLKIRLFYVSSTNRLILFCLPQYNSLEMFSSGGSAPGEFAHGKVDPSEAGMKDGLSSGGGTNTDSSSTGGTSGGRR